jgi:AcrR family transcriptional regulator
MPRSYTLSDKARADRLAQKQATRRALLDAARALVAERGVDGVSVVEVGRRAGVSHSLINAYFDGKSGLMSALVKDFNEPQLTRSRDIASGPGTPEARVRGILLAWATFDLADPALLRVLQAHSWDWSDAAEAENRLDRQRGLAPLGHLIQEGQSLQQFRRDLALAEGLAAIWAIYTNGMREAVFARPIPTPDQAITAIWGQVLAVLTDSSARP